MIYDTLAPHCRVSSFIIRRNKYRIPLKSDALTSGKGSEKLSLDSENVRVSVKRFGPQLVFPQMTPLDPV